MSSAHAHAREAVVARSEPPILPRSILEAWNTSTLNGRRARRGLVEDEHVGLAHIGAGRWGDLLPIAAADLDAVSLKLLPIRCAITLPAAGR